MSPEIVIEITEGCRCARKSCGIEFALKSTPGRLGTVPCHTKWRFALDATPRLLCKPVSLGECADGDRMIDVQTAGFQSFSVEFQQGRVLYLCLENSHGRI